MYELSHACERFVSRLVRFGLGYSTLVLFCSLLFDVKY